MVVLTEDIPNEGLKAGDVGTSVHVHGNEKAYEVEFVTLTGVTVAAATVLPSPMYTNWRCQNSSGDSDGLFGTPPPDCRRVPICPRRRSGLLRA